LTAPMSISGFADRLHGSSGVIAPFTGAHQAQIRLGFWPPTQPVEPFLRCSDQLPGHPKLMTSSDKELIVRIQLGQMASISSLPSMLHGGNLLKHMEKNSSEASRDMRRAECKGTFSETMLIIELQETLISGISDSIQAPDSVPNEMYKNQVDASVSQDMERALQFTDMISADAARRFKDMFAKLASAPMNMPTTRQRDSGRSEGHPGSGDESHDCLDRKDESSACSSSPPRNKNSYRILQLEIERAYEEVMELEQTTFRLLDCHPFEHEKLKRIIQERGRLLDIVDRRFSISSSASESILPANTSCSKTGSHCQSNLLFSALDFSKGRLLLSRLLCCLVATCTSKIPSGELEVSAEKELQGVHLMWCILEALLRCPHTLLPPISCFGTLGCNRPKTKAYDHSWQKLHWSLAEGIRLASTLPGMDHASRCYACISSLLAHPEPFGTGDHMVAMCLSRDGALLLKHLIQGCGSNEQGHVARLARADEGDSMLQTAVPTSIISAACEALPLLYLASRFTAVGTSGENVTEVESQRAQYRRQYIELLHPEDLWTLYINLARVTDTASRQRLCKAISPFLGKLLENLRRDSAEML